MRYDAQSARCTVLVYREGLLAAAGHDLRLGVRKVELDVTLDPPGILARFDAGSLFVETALEHGQPRPHALSDRDRRTIEKHLAEDVLEVATNPEVGFTSTAIVAVAEGYSVEGRLTLRGQTRPLAFLVTATTGRLFARVRLDQADFGIRPFSAMFGALRIKSYVDVEIDIPRPS